LLERIAQDEAYRPEVLAPAVAQAKAWVGDLDPPPLERLGAADGEAEFPLLVLFDRLLAGLLETQVTLPEYPAKTLRQATDLNVLEVHFADRVVGLESECALV